MTELRVEGGRRLIGTVIRYGEVAPGFQERFEPGSLRLDDVLLNVQHERGQPLARTPQTLRMIDDAGELRMEATLPETRLAEDVIRLVRGGVLRGLSLGFQALADRYESGIRIVSAAVVDHVAIVDRPAYSGSVVAARADHRSAHQELDGLIEGLSIHREVSENVSTGLHVRARRRIWL